MIPLSLYVHLPWCVQKCPYCDFNSWAGANDAPRDRYLDALTADLDREAERGGGRELVSVFIGGGTPSVFTPDEIARLLDAIDARFSLANDVEITMEANPGTVESGAPAGYRRAGVNRLSIGAQSFSNAALETLGRIHRRDDIVRAVREARAVDFASINIDLMHGLPNQSLSAALQDIEAAVDLEPDHISWYQLTLEPNTVFHARPPRGLPDADTAYDIQEHGIALLEDRGFERYEVSAFARPGKRCRHNLNYWRFGDYLAAGAGAHGKITLQGSAYRYAKPMHPRAYIEAMVSGTAEPLSASLRDAELLFEYLLNALRLTDGFAENEFEARTGLAAAQLEHAASEVLDRGLIARESGGRWRPTALGQRFLNDLQSAFLP